MKRFCYGICGVLTCIFLQSCNRSDAFREQLKTLDSLSGAVNATISELQKTDTTILQKAITRFSHYRQFVHQNINDTIDKNAADNLQQFYSSGKSLEGFQTNRRSLLARAHLINSQLVKLTADVKSNTLNFDQAAQFVWQEKNETVKLTEAGSLQKQLFYSSLEEFKTSVRGLEQLIRSHNNGELPVIIKDTLSL